MIKEKDAVQNDLNKQVHKLQEALQKAKITIISTTQEIDEKQQEIEKLGKLLRNIEEQRSSLASKNSRPSLEQLSDSFNDLKLQQALDDRKKSVKQISDVMCQLADDSDPKTKEHVQKLQKQMSIVVEKQEVTDEALEKCAELCYFTLDHLNELARFLNALLQHKEIRESLSDATMFNIQSALDKTMEFSQQAGRFSIEARMSSLPNISSLEILMTTARISLANIQEIQSHNKSVQFSNDHEMEILQSEMETMKKELGDINRVNQMLEDEICQLKESLQGYKSKLIERDEEVEQLSIKEKSMETKLQEFETAVEDAAVKRDELERKLQAETKKKFETQTHLMKSETLAGKLQAKLDILQKDFEDNWITRAEHVVTVTKLEDDIVNGEAHVAAIRMETDSLRSKLMEVQAENEIYNRAEVVALEALRAEDEKENVVDVTGRRTLEISEDRKKLLSMNSDSAVTPTTDPCDMCPKYQAKVAELKKYLGRAIEKIKMQNEMKTQNDRHIQKQLNNTESFMQKARSNMESILKSRNATNN